MKSEEIGELVTALVKAQSKITGAVKDKVNPHFKNHYADLGSVWDACRAPLTENGLAVVQTPEQCEDGLCLRTLLLHTSGQWIDSTLPLSCDARNAQAVGSALTYARRYALAAMVGVCPEDDDGQGAVAAPAPHREQAPRHEQKPLPEQFRREGGSPPSQARPDATRNNDRQYDGPPRHGKGLFAWASKTEEEGNSGLIKHLNAFAKSQGYPWKMSEFNEEQVAAVYEEAQGWLAETANAM